MCCTDRKQTDRHTDRQTERQTDICTDTHLIASVAKIGALGPRALGTDPGGAYKHQDLKGYLTPLGLDVPWAQRHLMPKGCLEVL